MDAFDHEKMKCVARQLQRLPLRQASFFIVPGADRDAKTWDIKPMSRTARLRPGIDLTASRTFFVEFMREFKWFDRIVYMEPAKDCKEFVAFFKDAELPVFVKDDTLFTETCVADAERMM
jgi:hypothetical protein